MNSPSPLINRAAPWPQGAAAYGFLMLAGWAVAAMVLGAFVGWGDIAGALRHPLSDNFWMLALAGPAAVIGAAAVHRPFVQALRTDSVSAVHRWTLAGVLAAHAAYATMNAAQYLMWESSSGYRLYFADPLGNAIISGLLMGATSLLLGLLPTALIALAFAEFLLWAHRKNTPSPPTTEVQSTLEGVNHDPAATAE